MDSLRALLAQLTPVPHDVRANTATAVRLLVEHPDADVVVLPELFLHGYTLPGLEGLALGLDDEPLRRLREAAAEQRTAVIVGFAERTPGGLPANSVACIDERGDVAGVYRKVHLFGSEVEHFTRGTQLTLARLCGLVVGPLICYDVEFPEPARALTVAGAHVLVTVSANMAPYLDEHQLFARARAVENRRPHVYVNRVGAESGLTFVGGSCVVDATGAGSSLGDGDEVRLVEVPLGAPSGPDYLADRRPDVPVVPATPF